MSDSTPFDDESGWGALERVVRAREPATAAVTTKGVILARFVALTTPNAAGAALSNNTPSPPGVAWAGDSLEASRSNHTHALPTAWPGAGITIGGLAFSKSGDRLFTSASLETAGVLYAAGVQSEGPVRVRNYSLSALPDPAASGFSAGSAIFVGNLTGGAEWCFSDGTNWRRMSDRSVAS